MCIRDRYAGEFAEAVGKYDIEVMIEILENSYYYDENGEKYKYAAKLIKKSNGQAKTVWSVSYTHLDVYKRQVCTLPVYGCGVDGIVIFLQYGLKVCNGGVVCDLYGLAESRIKTAYFPVGHRIGFSVGISGFGGYDALYRCV